MKHIKENKFRKLVRSNAKSICINTAKELLLFTFVFSALIIQGQEPFQDPTEKRTPNSPIASELGKYGQIPIGLITGVPMINIPLYNYTAGELQIPVSLSYSSNGVKVDQMSTSVGLGWVLNAGGVITRVVKDQPDEEEIEVYPDKDIHQYGIYDYEAMEYFLAASESLYDSEADEYSYYVNGSLSGKFIYNNQGVIANLPHSSNLILPISYNDSLSYEIADIDGVRYVFSMRETSECHTTNNLDNINPRIVTSWYLTKIIHPQGDTVFFEYKYADYTYTAGISEIIEKRPVLGGYCATLYCAPGETITFYKNVSRIRGYLLKKIRSNNILNGYIAIDYQDYPMEDPTVSGGYKLVDKISVYNNKNEIIENYDFDYLITNKHRVFLTSINFKDPDKRYQFEYFEPNDLCKRLEYSQDYFGYYNGANNLHFVPNIHGGFFSNYGDREPNHSYSMKGLLKKIVYPTKGETKLEYEANSYSGQKVICPPKSHLSLSLESTYEDEFGVIINQETDTIPFNQEVVIENYSVGLNPYDEYCITENIPIDPTAWFCIIDMSVMPNKKIPFYKNSPNGFIFHGTQIEITEGMNQPFKVFLEKGKKYKCELKVNKNCLVAGLGFNYYNLDCDTIQDNIETGGSRIMRTIDFDPLTNSESIKRYYYNRFEELNKSSGDNGYRGNYFYSKKTQNLCANPNNAYWTVFECPYYVVSSSSRNSLFNQDNNNIFYHYVTISHGGENFENGGETHNFIINRDILGNILLGDNSANVWSNTGWNHAKEKSVEYFKIENSVKSAIKKIENFYSTAILDTIYSYSINKNYQPITVLQHHRICTEEETTKKTLRVRCKAPFPHTHSWCLGGCAVGSFIQLLFGCNTFFINVSDHSHCIACGADNEYYWQYDHCFGRTPGDTITYHNAIEHLNIVEYTHYSFWTKLDSTIVLDYNSFGQNPLKKKTEFFYNNLLHSQLSKKSTLESDGSITTEEYWFPYDYNTTYSFDTLIGKNILNTVVDYRKSISNTLTAGKTIKYNTVGQPIEIFKAENELGSALNWYINNPYSYGVPYAYLSYNSKHRLIGQQVADKNTVSTIWGYGESKVLAITENSQPSEAGYTSFENSELNEWQKYPANTIINDVSVSHTGESCIRLNQEAGPFRVFSVGDYAANHPAYKASVWVKGSSQAYLHIEVNGVLTTKVRQTNANGGTDWNLLEVEIPQKNYEDYMGSGLQFKVYVGGDPNALFDDLRFHPSDAMMTSYTYKPLIGITSESDSRNMPAYYEYDTFGRLKMVRDQQGNILKTYDYNYAH